MPVLCFSMMYWSDWQEDSRDANRGSIRKAWMDGSNSGILITSKNMLWPNGLSLDIEQGMLHWVDAYYDRIETVLLNTTERRVRKSAKHSDENIPRESFNSGGVCSFWLVNDSVFRVIVSCSIREKCTLHFTVKV